MQKAIVFDMDGVIFDTEALCLKLWQKISDRHGEGDMTEFALGMAGMGVEEAKAFAKKTFGEDYPYELRRAELREEFKNFASENPIPQKEGVNEIFKFLKQHGYKIALASSTRRESVESHLKGAGLFDIFDAIVCGDDVKIGKPNPDIYLTACKKLNVNSKEAFAVEDSYNGVKSASSAGMKVIMVPDLLPPIEEIKKLTFSVQNSLLDVINILPQ